MSKKSTALAVLPPEKLQTGSVANWQQCFHKSSAAEVAESIKERMAESERFGRVSVYAAIMNGLKLIFIRDNGPRGALTGFINEFFDAASRRTLGAHMRAAQGFLNTAGILDKTTHKLKNGSAIAPILETQLHLFLSPEAEKFDGIRRKLQKYIGEKSLRELMRLMADNDSSPPKNYGNAGGANKRPNIERRRTDAEESIGTVELFATSKDWMLLHDADLARLDNSLGEFHAQVGAAVKDRARAQEKVDRTANGKGARS